MKIKFWHIAIILVFVLLIMWQCNKCRNAVKSNGIDTISIKHDTVWNEQKADTIYRPKPYAIIQYKPQLQRETVFDTLYEFLLKEIDTIAILKDFFATRVYSDTQNIKYGKIIINDSVTMNKIKARRLITDISIPEITNTITVQRPRKAQIYLGINVLANVNQPIYIGGSALMKTKRDMIYELGGMYGNDQKLYFGSIKFLISLKRK